MTQTQINREYTELMISSMQQDLHKWTMESAGAAGMAWLEFMSPEYKTENGSRRTFGFNLNYTGVWIDGRIAWTVPATIKLNPFNPLFWQFHSARISMMRYLKRQETTKHLEYLSRNL